MIPARCVVETQVRKFRDRRVWIDKSSLRSVPPRCISQSFLRSLSAGLTIDVHAIRRLHCVIAPQLLKERLRKRKVKCVVGFSGGCRITMQHAIAPIEDTRMTTLLRLVSRVSMGTRTICDEVKTVSMDSRGEYERTFRVPRSRVLVLISL